MTDQTQAQDQVQDQEQQELSERQRILRDSRRWHATDTWRMSQDEFRARARTGEFTPEPETSPEQGG